jgi:hypothetical protein
MGFILVVYSFNPWIHILLLFLIQKGRVSTYPHLNHAHHHWYDFILIVIGGIGAIAVLVLISIPSTSDVGAKLKWVFKIEPNFAMSYGVIAISSR